MKIDAENFKQAVRHLDESLKSGVEDGCDLGEMRAEYEKRCKGLLFEAARSSSWNEIVDHLAFLIFAGGAQDILVQKATEHTNMLINMINTSCTPAINKLADEVTVSRASVESLRLELKNGRASFSSKGAQARLANDPKQKAKEEVKLCWLSWQEHPTRYKGTAAFARDMLDKFNDTLESHKVIEAWCRRWKSDKAI